MKRLKTLLSAYLGYWIYRLLSITWRVELDEQTPFLEEIEEPRPVVIAHWHGNELALIHLVRRYRIATLASQSRDGEIMSRILVSLGAATSRGSSSRGGMAGLRGLVRLCRSNRHNVSFAIDGPKGPLHIVKPGVFEFSRLMSAPIYAASVSADRVWRLHRSWNRAILPKPFARVHIRFVRVFDPISKSMDIHDPTLADRLAQQL